MKFCDTNENILTKAQNIIIARGETEQNYPIEQHLEDMDLIADLTELKRKYSKRSKGMMQYENE